LEELESLGISLPDLPYTVYDKADGSLIQIFMYEGKFVVASMGSFTSPQAIVAEKMLYEKYAHLHKYFKDGMTYLFELVYPLNKIVLDYGDEEKLLLLAMRTSNDSEFSPDYNNSAMLRYWKQYGFDVVEEVEMKLEDLKDEVGREDFINKEGFVVVFGNGFRVKMKYAEYFRLHKIISNVNERFVWEFVSQGKPIELDNIPDETFQFIKNTEKMLKERFTEKWNEAHKIYIESLNELSDIHGDDFSKKDFALHILPRHKKMAGILFKIWEQKPVSAAVIIWKMLRPKYADGPSGFQSMKIEA
jgi:RNA ligase